MKTTVLQHRAQPLPFLLTPQQGEAARTLLDYLDSLQLPSPDAQLLAVVVSPSGLHAAVSAT
ncbi:hypothetical protein ABZ829_22250 [Streptomyces xanthochromogenes]|uniref:hypothetical protein n=1 Tax=Streptomyces xanthochromogenes TaxID=67384 RepID=UPI0034391761